MSAWNSEAIRIFASAAVISDEEVRLRFVANQCGDDQALRTHVEALISAGEQASRFLEKPVIQRRQIAETLQANPGGTTGSVIGAYKLLQQIGEGGFGVVYMAEQKEPVRRHVALKIIKPDLQTREVIARFEAERQALALMDHPNIATVLDAGETDDGRPFFVMELVKGVPVTEFCRKNNFSTRQRLELFKTICQAIQHAHQKGVIHRDLKPSNVMVTLHDGKPVAKVIDFGISKAISQQLTEKTLFTRYGQMVGTPQYMSPEQAEMSGLDVDTRSDIYSLGVMLYELLTGTTPISAEQLRSARYAEMVRLIVEHDPPKPSTRITDSMASDTLAENYGSADAGRLHQLVMGDLDWIVMKAVDKDRAHRYETASAFADDITRHLNDQPVLAGRPGNLYRVRKFVRRNKGCVAATVAVASALVIGLAAASAGFVKANQQKQIAIAMRSQADKAKAEAVRRAEEAQAERAIAQEQGDRAEMTLALLKEMLSSANPTKRRGANYSVLQMLDEFTADVDDKLGNSPDVGSEVWGTIAEVYYSLSELHKAKRYFRRAIELKRNSQDTRSGLVPLLVNASECMLNRSNFDEEYTDAVKAEAMLREALELLDPGETSYHSFITVLLGWSLQTQNRFVEAEEILRQAIAMRNRQSTEDGPLEAGALMLLANNIWWSDANRLDEALTCASRAVDIFRSHRSVEYLGMALKSKGAVLLQQRRTQESDAILAEALEVLSHEREFGGFDYIHIANVRIWTLLGLGKEEEANDLIADTLAICRKTDKRIFESITLYIRANMLVLNGQFSEAEESCREAAALCEREFGRKHMQTVLARLRLAQHLELVGNLPESGKLYSHLLPHIEQIVAETESNVVWNSHVAFVQSHRPASSLQEIGQALATARKSLESIGRLHDDMARVAVARALERSNQKREAVHTLTTGLADRCFRYSYPWLIMEQRLLRILEQLGQTSEIEAVLLDAVQHRETVLTSNHRATLVAKTKLAAWLMDQERALNGKEHLASCRMLLEHENATGEDRRLAVDTAIKINYTMDEPHDLGFWQSQPAGRRLTETTE